MATIPAQAEIQRLRTKLSTVLRQLGTVPMSSSVRERFVAEYNALDRVGEALETDAAQGALVGSDYLAWRDQVNALVTRMNRIIAGEVAPPQPPEPPQSAAPPRGAASGPLEPPQTQSRWRAPLLASAAGVAAGAMAVALWHLRR